MKRVTIVGIPGAGKSTFARRLSAATHLPSIHLDYYLHQQYAYYEVNPDKWVTKVKELVELSDYWIMDGNSSVTYEFRFPVSDIVFVLDYPTRIALFRILRRRFMYNTQHRSDMPEHWQEKFNWGFMKYVLAYRKYKRKRIYQELAKCPPKKQQIFTHPRQAEAYLRKLENN